MKQYLTLLEKVYATGVVKPSGRPGMPNVVGITHGAIEMDLRKGFPLLTTKKMFWTGIAHELIWFMRGDTNIKYLVDNNCNFWTPNAYKHYLRICEEQYVPTVRRATIEEFVEGVKASHLEGSSLTRYIPGDLGPVYGKQWRNNNGIDQLRLVYESIKTNPYERYKIIDVWNAKEKPQMALPPCLLLYQFLVEPVGKAMYLDLNMYQRSADLFLGVPFDIASMSMFLAIMAKATGTIPRYAYWTGGHCDIYESHLPVVEEQLARKPTVLPNFFVNKEINSFEDLISITIDDLQISDYNYQPALKGELYA